MSSPIESTLAAVCCAFLVCATGCTARVGFAPREEPCATCGDRDGSAAGDRITGSGDDVNGGDVEPGGDDPGGGDPGGGDPGAGDPGAGDPGAGDPGGGDPGAGDPGAGDPGAGDPGAGDPGAGDPGAGDPGGTSCAGELVGGYCWYLGAESGECSAACSTHGGTNAAGALWAGSDAPSPDNCNDVLTALEGVPGTTVDFGCTVGWGCAIRHDFLSNEFRNRCADTPTDPDVGTLLIERACACNE